MTFRLPALTRTRFTVPVALAAVLVAGLVVVAPGVNRD